MGVHGWAFKKSVFSSSTSERASNHKILLSLTKGRLYAAP
jgi:hypothetical protein